MTQPLAARFAQQAEQCRRNGSPLTAEIIAGAGAELDRPGPVRDLLMPLADDPPGSVPALRFAGALHRLVLERQAPELALYYPSVGGNAGPTHVWPVARQLIARADRLPELVRQPVQTNEVGRSAVLYGGLLSLQGEYGLSVRLLEMGASAGLNLRVDAFGYQVGDRRLGDPASPVQFRQPWQGSPPGEAAGLRLDERLGCDQAPLDPTSTADRLTLTSYVWADQVERLERLRGALQVAARRPARVEQLSAATFLARELGEPRPGVLTLVWHSVLWQYLDQVERAAVTATLRTAGRRASIAAPLAQLSLEPAMVGDGKFRFLVELVTWPGGHRRLLAEAEGHGPPVRWHS